MKKKSIIFLGDSFTFPEGEAATNRVYTYAKGFLKNGIDPKVICFRSDYLDIHNGESEGIIYYHPFRQSIRNPDFVIRRLHNLMKYLNTLRLLKKIKSESDIGLILVYTIRINTQLFAFLLSRLFGTKLVIERSEHPFKAYRSRVSEIVFGRFRVLFELMFTDYIFCISDFLIAFYRSRGAREKTLLKVPSTVDSSRFINPVMRKIEGRYICYSGSLTGPKDGVDVLIKSFSLIASEFSDIMLVLVGKADTLEDELLFRSLVTEMGITDRVVFTGKVSRVDIPSYVCNAEALVLARPDSIVADAGFPSKVSEYLSAGRPVIVTRVGEIPVYLSDNCSAFLADPGDIESFAGKLRFVLKEKELAKEVGLKGQEVALRVFDYHIQVKRIIEFLEQEGQV